MDEDATWYGTRPRPSHIVLDGVPAPAKGAQQPPLFGQAEAFLHAKFHLDPCSRLVTIDMCRKLGALPPFGEGELGPHLTQCRLGRGLSSYQVAS